MKKIALSIVLGTVLLAHTVTDSTTGLMWQDNSDAKTVKKDWQGAIDYCENLSFLGYTDWKLPTRLELLSIADKTKSSPAINEGFQNVVSDYYWSSSGSVNLSDGAWDVSFGNGNVNTYNKDNSNYVRCVRDSTLTLDSFSSVYEKVVEYAMESLPKPPMQSEITKGEFEKQRDFEVRVEAARRANSGALSQYKLEYQEYYPRAKKEAMKKSLEIFYGKPIISNLAYDAENEIFGATLTFENNKEVTHNIALKMAPNEAAKFKSNFSAINPVALFHFDGNNVSLKTVKLAHNQKEYIAMFTDSAIRGSSAQVAHLDVTQPVMSNVSSAISVNQGNYKTFDTSTLVTTNDLDNLLAKAPQANSDSKKWLFAIGLENYKYTDNVVYAARSADMFARVAQKSLGVPAQNSYVLMNEGATATEIKTKMKLMLRNVKEGDSIYFYYNGHGVPAVDKGNEPYILSSDMMPDFVGDEPSFMMKQMYKELSDSKAGSIIAVIDSCFSGSTDGKSIQKGVAATRVKPKDIDFDKTKMVVLTAGKGTQYSNAYNQKSHRMFSYFVMEELLKGDKNLKELYGNVYKNTKETTQTNYGDMRIQEPTMDGNSEINF
jgi:hypothetical protein